MLVVGVGSCGMVVWSILCVIVWLCLSPQHVETKAEFSICPWPVGNLLPNRSCGILSRAQTSFSASLPPISGHLLPSVGSTPEMRLDMVGRSCCGILGVGGVREGGSKLTGAGEVLEPPPCYFFTSLPCHLLVRRNWDVLPLGFGQIPTFPLGLPGGTALSW